MKEAEEEERTKRLGPGGLDPVEVFESLPSELQACFESQDVKQLQDTILKMKREDAEYHMDRCVKSGLWVPDGAKKDLNSDNSVYAEVDDNVSSGINKKLDLD